MFKRVVVAAWGEDDWSISEAEIRAAVQGYERNACSGEPGDDVSENEPGAL